MGKNSEILITTPNAFGLLHFIRYTANVFREGSDHVLSLSIFTLQNLLGRHGFHIEGPYTYYNRPASGWKDILRYLIGIPFFKTFPEFGGTLLVVARPR